MKARPFVEIIDEYSEKRAAELDADAFRYLSAFVDPENYLRSKVREERMLRARESAIAFLTEMQTGGASNNYEVNELIAYFQDLREIEQIDRKILEARGISIGQRDSLPARA